MQPFPPRSNTARSGPFPASVRHQSGYSVAAAIARRCAGGPKGHVLCTPINTGTDGKEICAWPDCIQEGNRTHCEYIGYVHRQRRKNPHYGHMENWTHPDLSILAGLYLQNEDSFFICRCLHRFLAGELTAREAIERIRRHPDVLDQDPHPFHFLSYQIHDR